MCGSFGGAVHVNSGVREGSPSRRSYEGCATIVIKIQKCFLKLERYSTDIHTPNYSDQTRGTKAAITGMSPVCLAVSTCPRCLPTQVSTCPGVLVSMPAAMS